MTVPLIVLALGSVLAGWLGTPKLWAHVRSGSADSKHWLEPVVRLGSGRSGARGRARRQHRVDSDGRLGGGRA